MNQQPNMNINSNNSNSNNNNNNANVNNAPNQRPQANRQINIQPAQVAQLAAKLKNEFALAKAAGNDKVKAAQHYATANSIRQILLNYQQQQKAKLAAQGGPQPQLQAPQAQAPAQPQARPTQQPNQQPNQGQGQFNTYNQGNPQLTGMQSPLLQNVGINSPATAGNSAPQQRPMVGTPGSASTSGSSGSNATGKEITVEKFNQVRQRVIDFEKKIKQLEAEKTYATTPEQQAAIDTRISDLRTKSTSFQTYATYMKAHLVKQAKLQQQQQQQQQQGGQTPNPASAAAYQRAPGTLTPTPLPQQNLNQTPNLQNLQQQQRAPIQPPVGNKPIIQQGLPLSSTGTGVGAVTPRAGSSSGLVGVPTPVPGTNASIGGPNVVNVSTPIAGTPSATSVAPRQTVQGRSVSPPNAQNRSASPANGTVSGPPSLNLTGITKPSVPSIPISSTINVKPPTAVTLKPNGNNNRASLMGGNANGIGPILGTPAMTKMPTYEYAAGMGGENPDSGRVLTKRKLNELVNTIGADEGDGKTNIDGDVEELLLDLADEFITSVTGFACRLAKHRKVESVDVRDIQLHLERNWNIRIPGYAMDEIRSTRRLQPSTSYTQKVSGVEISKSVNGNLN